MQNLLFFSFFGNNNNIQQLSTVTPSANPATNASLAADYESIITNCTINKDSVRRGYPIVAGGAGTVNYMFDEVIPSFFGAFAQRLFPISK